ncbi:LuxR C-terminal-related transcriptional regulator [Rufibacter roseus]|uniref:LuxR C-terminal-related transcriptional regulator n=1 Tax=Rufibacter roseus TaxID=1567108 RepID=A0ABW2DNJ7_9BACT|nr:LuxR C-terminal-related transcriptional regulator [Rufibacter roseus]
MENMMSESTEVEVAEIEALRQQVGMLKEKCAFLERVVNEVPANIYVSDLKTGVVWCNQTNEETLGYTLEEIRQMSAMEYMEKIVHPDDLNIPQDSIVHYQSYDGAEYGGVFRAKHKLEQEYRWFIGWAKPFIKDGQGEVKKLLCVDVDMSPRMTTEKQLVTALQENLKKKNGLLIKSLSKREKEVLQLVCKGKSSKNIADELCLSVHTVNTHRKNIQARLGTGNVADLVLLAKEAGLD